MIELGKEKRQIIRPLCGQADHVLVHGAVRGYMGRVWVPELTNPSYCLIHLGDFAYLFGICPKGEQAMELKAQLYRECGQDYITPSDERWAEWLEESFPGEYRVLSRYSMRRDRNHFSEEALESYCGNLPAGIRLKKIDKRLYQTALKEEWSRDFCSNFETPEEFEQNGLGFVAMDGRKIVSGCSAYGISRECLRYRLRPGRSTSGRGWPWRAAPGSSSRVWSRGSIRAGMQSAYSQSGWRRSWDIYLTGNTKFISSTIWRAAF